MILYNYLQAFATFTFNGLPLGR